MNTMKRRIFLKCAAGLIAAAGTNLNCRPVTELSGKSKSSKARKIAFKNLRRTPPTDEEYLDFSKRFRNWGRWGENDKQGTLNFVDSGTVKSAQGLIRRGISISMGRPIANAEFSMQ